MKIHDARRGVRQIGELVVVRGEQRLRLCDRVGGEILGDGPRDAQAIESRRAAADLVEHHETPGGRVVQDVGRLLHLDHERRVTAGDVVRRTDAREDAIDERNLRRAGRNERTGLRHDGEQRRLPQIRRFPAHVRAGQDHQLRGRAVEADVVRHKRLAGSRGAALDDGMSSVADDEFGAIMDLRLDVVVRGRRLGKGREHVERGERP